MNMSFTSESSPKTMQALHDILRAQAASRRLRRDYPGHEHWLPNTLRQLLVGQKSFVLGILDDMPMVSGIYQLHPTNPTIVEVRNVAVKGPESRQKILVQSLVNAVTLAAAADFPHASFMIGDTKSTNGELIDTMQGIGWSVVGTTTLVSEYGSNGVPDAVMMRELPGRRRVNNLIMPRLSS